MSERTDDIEIQDPNLGQQAAAVAEIERQSTVDPDCGVIRSGRLKGLTMWGAIFVLSWPVLIESFLNALVGLVDTTLAAYTSEAATDAIGVASYFQWFIGLIAVALGVGATAMISRAMGRGRTAVANAVVGQIVLLSGVLGTAAGLGIAMASPFIARMMALPPGSEAYTYAVDYLRIVSFGVPALTLLFSGMASCRGAGDAVRPMLTMAVVNAVNIAASYVLSGVQIPWLGFSNPFGFSLGVHGIAYGTLVAWWVGAIVILAILGMGTHGLRLRTRRLKPHWHTIRRLVRVGVPNFFETAGMWFGNFITVLMVGWMGAQGLYGAHVIAIRIEAFSFLPGFAMATAAATLAGQYIGAGCPHLATRAILRCASIAALIMGALGVAFITIPEQIVSVFSAQEIHMELSPRLVQVCGLVQIPFALVIVIRGALRGAGDTKVTMLLTWTSTWGIRLPLAWLCSGVEIPLHQLAELVGIAMDPTFVPNPAPLQRMFDIPPLVGLWIGLCGELAVRFLLFLARFIQGGWQRVKV
ncbi:MAG: MATE family efflux transporter [Planctomycetota bacterium]